MFQASTPTPSQSRKSVDHSKPRSESTAAMNGHIAPPKRGSNAPLFYENTKAIVWGMQSRAVQGMLDFDYSCSRDEPSVVCMVYPFVGDHKQKFYWGHKEILIPGKILQIDS